MKKVIFALILLSSTSCEAKAHIVPSSPAPYNWTRVAVGAGGFVVGISIAPDGTKVVKTDVGGGYRWDAGQSKWIQLVTAQSMPTSWISSAAYQGSNSYPLGVWEVVVAPNNTQRFYMFWNGYFFRSDNRGGYWTQSSLTRLDNSSGAAFANGTYKSAQQKIAVDPANADVLYAATNTSGIEFSNDGAQTWTQVSSVTASTTGPGGAGLIFDTTAGTVTVGGQTRTKNVYLSSFGNGVWASTDGGVTFTQIANGSGGLSPINVYVAAIGADGVYWCTDHVNVWKYTAGGGFVKAKVYAAQAIVTDPNNAGHVIISGPSGGNFINMTMNNGADNFVGAVWTGYATTGSAFIGQVATDIPWLATSDTAFLSVGELQYDPSDGNMYFAEGIGVFKMPMPTAQAHLTWTSQSAGIEEMVSNDILAPTGSDHVCFGMWDRGVFCLPNNALTTFLSAYGTVNGTFIGGGWSLSAAADGSSYITCLCMGTTNVPGYSTDWGATWTPFSAGFTTVTNVQNNGSGHPRLTVGSTTGFQSWSGGSGTIADCEGFLSTANNAEKGLHEITVVDSTHLDLTYLTPGGTIAFSGGAPAVCINNRTNMPLWTHGDGVVIGAANNGAGLIRLNIGNASVFAGGFVHISGVTGTTEANGNWLTTSVDATHIDLNNSTFTNAYTGGGLAVNGVPQGGCIATADSNDTVMIPGNNGYIFYTKDGGQTWLQAPGLPTVGWINSSFLKSCPMAADASGNFYGYNASPTVGIGGWWKSTDHGDTWTLINSTQIANDGFNERLRATPGSSNDLWFTSGNVGGTQPVNSPFYRVTDNGSGVLTFKAIPNVKEVDDFGFGKPKAGNTYPALYIFGWVNNQFGIWRSDDADQATPHWTYLMNLFPGDWADGIKTINGDMNKYGRVYAGFNGTGFVYGDPAH